MLEIEDVCVNVAILGVADESREKEDEEVDDWFTEGDSEAPADREIIETVAVLVCFTVLVTEFDADGDVDTEGEEDARTEEESETVWKRVTEVNPEGVYVGDPVCDRVCKAEADELVDTEGEREARVDVVLEADTEVELVVVLETIIVVVTDTLAVELREMTFEGVDDGDFETVVDAEDVLDEVIDPEVERLLVSVTEFEGVNESLDENVSTAEAELSGEADKIIEGVRRDDFESRNEGDMNADGEVVGDGRAVFVVEIEDDIDGDIVPVLLTVEEPVLVFDTLVVEDRETEDVSERVPAPVFEGDVDTDDDLEARTDAVSDETGVKVVVGRADLVDDFETRGELESDGEFDVLGEDEDDLVDDLEAVPRPETDDDFVTRKLFETNEVSETEEETELDLVVVADGDQVFVDVALAEIVFEALVDLLELTDPEIVFESLDDNELLAERIEVIVAFGENEGTVEEEGERESKVPDSRAEKDGVFDTVDVGLIVLVPTLVGLSSGSLLALELDDGVLETDIDAVAVGVPFILFVLDGEPKSDLVPVFVDDSVLDPIDDTVTRIDTEIAGVAELDFDFEGLPVAVEVADGDIV